MRVTELLNDHGWLRPAAWSFAWVQAKGAVEPFATS